MAGMCCTGSEVFESCLCVGEECTTLAGRPDDVWDDAPDVAIVEQSLEPPILVPDVSLDLTQPSEAPHEVTADGASPSAGAPPEQTRGMKEQIYNREASSKPSDVGTLKKSGRSLPLCQIIQESGASSLPDTGSGSWDAGARATYYHNKLMSTLQVLANKEETVRVQAESLRVAEARIAGLAARAQRLRAELDDKAQELRTLQRSTNKCKAEKMDVSVTADVQEVENQKHVVSTLQTNLSVIEDLYRECFYETAKQEELIEMLRKSYLDVRLMDKQKCDQIDRLQSVIDTQKWSLDRCQDIAVEVEGLKMEISNFLSSSNNDSVLRY